MADQLVGGVGKRLSVRMIKLSIHDSGAIAQLGERIVRNDEVVGSIPTSSTNFTKILPSATLCGLRR